MLLLQGRLHPPTPEVMSSNNMSKMEKVRQYAVKRGAEIVENLGKNNLWKRMLKNMVATTMLGAGNL